MIATQFEAVVPTSEPILHRIRSEYFEMPDLSLTLSQAKRLWGLSAQECEIVLGQLVLRGFLRQTDGGAFIRAQIANPCSQRDTALASVPSAARARQIFRAASGS